MKVIKIIGNILIFIVILIIIGFLIYSGLNSNKLITKQQTYKFNGLVFKSDYNIPKQLKLLADANKIDVFSFQVNNLPETNGSGLLYLETYSFLHKDYRVFNLYKDNNLCTIFEFKKRNYASGSKNINYCLDLVDTNRYTIYLHLPNLKLKDPTIFLDHKKIDIYPNTNYNIFTTNKKFMTMLVPNLQDIQNKIQSFVNNAKLPKK